MRLHTMSTQSVEVVKMDHDCVVFGCRNSSLIPLAKKNDCKFFNFPLDKPGLVEKWLKKLSLKGWYPGKDNVVCEEHFSLDSFEIVNDARILKPEAIPNVVDSLERILTNNAMIFKKDSTEQTITKEFRCRICANFLSQKNAIDIYREDDNVMEKLMACIPILVKNSDCLPKYICKLCLADLNISYRMLVRAMDSEKLFNNLVNKSEDKNHENDDNEDNKEFIKHLCVICNLNFNDVDDLSTHFQEKHVDELEFTDHDEEKHSNDMDCDNFRDDLLSFVDVKSCDDNSSNDPLIKSEHKPNSSGEKHENDDYSKDEISDKWACNVCPMNFCDEDLLAFHKETFHKDNQDNTEDIESGIEDEQMNEENGDSLCLACDLCPQVFNSVEELDEHKIAHTKSCICDICGRICDDLENLKKHRESHPKRPYRSKSCPVCFIVFLTHLEMVRHARDVHKLRDILDDSAPQKWICKYCGKEIGTKLSLSIHERIHTGVRPYVCECCGRSFKSKANLIQHQPVHTGVKRYKCSVCDKAFARKAFVTTHMRVHTGERPYKCEVCGNRYTQIGDLRRHQKRHTASSSHDVTVVEESSESYVEIADANDLNKDSSSTSSSVFENSSLFKVHFPKDVTDFRRILVELQQ